MNTLNMYRSDDVAFFHGCKRTESSDYVANTAHKKGWAPQPCIRKSSKMLLTPGYIAVKHYTLKKCSLTEEVLALCLLARIHLGVRKWALDRIHPIGKCPYCEYKDYYAP